MTTTWFLFVFSALLCCRLSECFHPYQQTFFWHSSALQRSLANPLSRLNAKGFGKISHASDEVGGKKTEDNNSDIDDILLQTIAAKEAEFQAELGTISLTPLFSPLSLTHTHTHTRTSSDPSSDPPFSGWVMLRGPTARRSDPLFWPTSYSHLSPALCISWPLFAR